MKREETSIDHGKTKNHTNIECIVGKYNYVLAKYCRFDDNKRKEVD